jgi:hypothetical protein
MGIGLWDPLIKGEDPPHLCGSSVQFGFCSVVTATFTVIMSNDDLKGLDPKTNKTHYVGSDTEEGMFTALQRQTIANLTRSSSTCRRC